MATSRGHTQTPSVHIFLQSATLPKSSLRISPRQITLDDAAVFAVFRPLHTSSCSANHRCYRLSRHATLERSVAHPPTATMLCSTTPLLRSSDPPRACIYAKLVNYFFFFSPPSSISCALYTTTILLLFLILFPPSFFSSRP